MPRSVNPDLSKDWKVCLLATLAGCVEFKLMDPKTGKPRYGERSKLIGLLLTNWLTEVGGPKIEVESPAADLIPQGAPK